MQQRPLGWMGLITTLFFWLAPVTTWGAELVSDSALTDANTPLLIDVPANDQDATGKPMTVSVVSEDCPGTVQSLFDDTLLYDPTAAVATVTVCTIVYQVQGAGSANVQLTVLPGDGTGGGNPPSGPCGGGWSPGLFQPTGAGFSYQDEAVTLAGYYPGLQTFSRTQHNSQAPVFSTQYRTLIDTLAERDINLIRVALTNFSTASNHGGYVRPYLRSSEC